MCRHEPRNDRAAQSCWWSTTVLRTRRRRTVNFAHSYGVRPVSISINGVLITATTYYSVPRSASYTHVIRTACTSTSMERRKTAKGLLHVTDVIRRRYDWRQEERPGSVHTSSCSVCYLHTYDFTLLRIVHRFIHVFNVRSTVDG